jgi:hypothetical protein
MPVPTNDSRSVPGAATVPGTAYIARPGTGRGRDGSVRYLYLRMLMFPPLFRAKRKEEFSLSTHYRFVGALADRTMALVSLWSSLFPLSLVESRPSPSL